MVEDCQDQHESDKTPGKFCSLSGKEGDKGLHVRRGGTSCRKTNPQDQEKKDVFEHFNAVVDFERWKLLSADSFVKNFLQKGKGAQRSAVEPANKESRKEGHAECHEPEGGFCEIRDVPQADIGNLGDGQHGLGHQAEIDESADKCYPAQEGVSKKQCAQRQG